jgi:hypothetical protein
MGTLMLSSKGVAAIPRASLSKYIYVVFIVTWIEILTYFHFIVVLAGTLKQVEFIIVNIYT